MKTTVDLVTAFASGKDEVYISAKQANWLESLMSKERLSYRGKGYIRWIPDTPYEYQRQYNGAGMLRKMKTVLF